MKSRILKSPRARILALAVGVGVIGSFATAPASFAAAPAVGTNCQLDGKISGRGSTFQKNALASALISGYTSDVCGPTGSSSNLQGGYATDPAGQSMIAYNYSQAGNSVGNGSGAGLTAMECRTDAFAGTDLPYNSSQLTRMNSAPGTVEPGKTCPNLGGSPSAVTAPPYLPQSPFPNSSDTAGPNGVMSFPIAGGAVAFAINLNGMCTTLPAQNQVFNVTQTEFESIWEGTVNQWNDSSLTGTNPILSSDGCHGTIQRIVRSDNSGTTAITMNDLNGIKSATLCDNGTTSPSSFGEWGTLGNINSPNTSWPTNANCKDSNGNVAPGVYNAGSTNTGSPPLIALLDSTTTPSGDPVRGSSDCPNGTASCGGEGGIGYAELGLWPGTLPTGVYFLHVQNAAASAFVSPGSPGGKSNCNPGANGLPGSGTSAEAVGLGGVDDNWANDSGADIATQSLQFENITDLGTGYPVCGLTFDFVYTGMSNETGEVNPTGSTTTVNGPMIGTKNDQLRTLYSFWTYAFSPLGQSYLDAQTYDELPAAWLPTLRSGFQSNY